VDDGKRKAKGKHDPPSNKAHTHRSVSHSAKESAEKLIILVQLFVGIEGPRFSGSRGKELCTGFCLNGPVSVVPRIFGSI
jgi:hypothetical protein